MGASAAPAFRNVPRYKSTLNGDNDQVSERIRVLAGLIGVAMTVGCLVGSTRASTSPCDLALKFGSRSGSPSSQLHVNLVVANTPYETPCRVSGFPDVELIGPVYPTFGSIYVMPDQAGQSQTIVLRSGQSAHAVLTWLPPSSRRDRWVPGYIRVVVATTRGPSFAMALPWRFGAVLRQDGATHPGTYIGPLRRGTR